MICYQDRTFCPYYKKCWKGHLCHRSLTDEVKDKARERGLPVCIFADKPKCYKEVDDDK